MKKSVKDAWINALESGKYTQTRDGWGGKSEGMDSYCCLQVLREEVLGIVGPETFGMSFEDDVLYHLPRDFIELCYEMNDMQKLSFQQIADRVREAQL